MAEALDARGLTCPYPSALVLRALTERAPDELIVWVDDPNSREQLARLARRHAYASTCVRREGYDEVTLRRSAGAGAVTL
ncbi:MAG: sulfurtransferase TusA family protein [Planctomycetes bacterium]|nr:sulfurtransferase TusA family protein [Planctomycetota bacterium]